MKKSWFISRRTMLRTAGTAISLPVLEAMIPGTSRADTPTPPRRFLAFHGQIYGYVGRNDAELGTMVAPWSATAPGYDVPIEQNTYLKPFFDKNLQSKITLLAGVTDRVMVGTHDSPVKLVANTYPVAKRRGGCVVLEATPGPDAFVGPPPQPDPFNGATADQIAARHLGKDTPLESLTMAVEPVGGDFASWPMSNKSMDQPIPAIQDPLDAFNRLFSGFDPQATAEEANRRAHYRQSVIDGVRGDAARLSARLGKSDRIKLEGYLDSVRSLEKLVQSTWQDLPPDLAPPGTSESYANNELKQKAMQELVAFAFVTDRTRVIAFSGQFAGNYLHFRGAGQEGLDYSHYRDFNGEAFAESHHTMSHYDQGLDGGAPSAAVTALKQQWMEIYSHWTLEMFADLLAKLDSYTDIDGVSTVLDNTLAIWGGDDSDSARHGYLSMPCVIGGRGGQDMDGWRIKSGRQLRFGAGGSSERSWKDLLWGAMNILGVPDPDGSPQLKSFGYATQPMDGYLRT